MIFLLQKNNKSDPIILKPDVDNIVGRKNATIILDNPSVSRKHAIIRIKNNNDAIIEDCGSKFFSLCNKTKLEAGIEIKLNHLDLLCFGADPTIFTFEKYEFITTASGLSAANKKMLCDHVNSCGGKFVSVWSKICTHLTVDTISITIKFLQAIIDEKPIVGLNYWSDYLTAIKNGTPLPSIPKLEDLPRDNTINNLNISEIKRNPKRKELFKNKLFVFHSSDIMKQISPAIKGCGGEYISWEEKPPDFTKQLKQGEKEYLFIKPENQSSSDTASELNDSFNAVLKDLAKQMKKPILLSEIALAVLYCSCEVNCNPNANKVKKIFPTDTEVPLKMNTLIPGTETQDSFGETPLINTIESTEEVVSGSKRKHTVIENNVSIINHKRARISPEKSQTIDTIPATPCPVPTSEFVSIKRNQKRKAEDDTREATSNKKPNLFNSINLNKNTSSIDQSQEENPFKLIRNSKSKSTDLNERNPFSNIQTQRRKTNQTPVENVPNIKIETIEEPTTSTNIPQIKTEIKTENTNEKSIRNNGITWISKSNLGQIKNISASISYNPDLLKIIEAFENCVKVEITNMTIRSYCPTGNTSSILSNTVKNFKKFRKIPPLRPQRSILGQQNFTDSVLPRNLEEFNDIVDRNTVSSDDDDDDDNEENAIQTKHVSKSKTRQFVF